MSDSRSLDNDFDGSQLLGMILVVFSKPFSLCKYYIRHDVYFIKLYNFYADHFSVT
jgi:hypothetical protein